MYDQTISRTIIIVTLALFALSAFLMLNSLCLYTPDSVRYLSLALSISRCEGYRDLYAPGNPVHVNFPPFYPILLLPAALLAPGHLIIASKILNILISVCALAALYLLLERVTSSLTGAVITALTAFNPLFVLHAAEVMSESAYLLISSVVLLMLIEADKGRPGRAFAAGVAAGAACLTRYSGVSLILAGMGVFFLRRDWRRGGLFLAAAIVVVTPWCVRDLFHILGSKGGASWGYGSSMAVSNPAQHFLLAEILRRMVSGVVRYAHMLGLLIFPFLSLQETGLEQCLSPVFLLSPPAGHFFACVLMVCTLLFVMAGVYGCARDRAKMVIIVYLAWYGAVLIFYPVREVRFLIPILVFLWMLMSDGMRVVGRILVRSANAARCFAAAFTAVYTCACLACTVCLAVTNLSFLGILHWNIPMAARYEYDLSGAAAWLKKNTPPDSVILCDRAELFFLSGRKVVGSGQYASVFGVFERNLREYDVKYIVAEALSGVSVYHRLMANAVMFDFEKVADFSTILIHKVIPRKTPREPYSENYESSVSSLLKQARERPDDPNVHRELGYFYFKEQKLDKAAEEFRIALDIDPGCPITWFNLGSAYLDRGRYDEAIAAFEKALAVRSADLISPLVEPSMKLAQVKKKIGDNPGDFENYRRYMEAAALYFQMKEYARALEELKSASAMRPGLAEPHLFMGDCYVKLGRKDDAMKSYQKALELNPAEDRARKGIENMRSK